MSLNFYDQACRYLVGFDGPGFLRWLLGLQSHEFAFNGWLDTRAILYPGERDRTGDLVAHLVDKAENDAPWAVLVEFQIEPDPDMFGRALRHLGSIWQFAWPDKKHTTRFKVGAAVLNLTGRGKCSRAMHWPQAKLSTEMLVAENNMEHQPASVLLDGVESGAWPRTLLPFVPLMLGGNEAGIITRWMAVASGEPSSPRRSDYAAIALIFADRAKRQPDWNNKLRGWNMTESAFLNEFIAKGRAEGEAEGEAKGELKGRMTALLEVLNDKFKKLPKRIENTIRKTKDVEVLRTWLTAAAKANTLEEFRAASGL